MTDQQHPITPPFELMNQWFKKACKDPYNGGKFIMAQTLKDFASSAAQWGADQELAACYTEVTFWGSKGMADRLQATRRPEPPSLKEQALAELRELPIDPELGVRASALDTIRRALEQLND